MKTNVPFSMDISRPIRETRYRAAGEPDIRASRRRVALYDGRWLVGSGLVNSVPVWVCRAMGADLVIAADLDVDLLGRLLKPRSVRGGPHLRAPSEPDTRTYLRLMDFHKRDVAIAAG